MELLGMYGSSGLQQAEREPREIAVQCGVLALLLLAYWGVFPPLQQAIGSPAFLFGLMPCLAAAVLLGLRGALVVVVVVAYIDRSFALGLSGPDTGFAPGVISLLAKLLLAGGLGMALDSRRRLGALNAELR